MYLTPFIILYPVIRYLVDQRWLKQWMINAGLDSWGQWKSGIEIGDPGPIDNLNLFKGNIFEKPHFGSFIIQILNQTP